MSDWIVVLIAYAMGNVMCMLTIMLVDRTKK